MASALSAVIGAAKACVSDADGISRATLEFSSNGTVSNVIVRGWAEAHGKSECIAAALKGATVPPFTKPTFTVGVTVRP
jgi:hypothetical protein